MQLRCGFRKATKKPESKKVEEELGPAHSESSEAAVQRRPPAPHWDRPPSTPRAFGRLIRPFLFTVGVGGVSGVWVELTLSAVSRTGGDSMSVHRLLLRLGGHLAVRVPQVSSAELLRGTASRLDGEGATS